jgi:small subunit ribosomal protein S2
MKALLETGVHFGHRTRKWNPRMKPYIFTERNGIHIIDLQQTLEALEETYALVRDTVQEGGAVLFVGTKRQAQETIELEATRCGMPYVNLRWLGGTLTNWRTIRSRIDELENLERRRDEGQFELLTKREALSMTRRIDKLEGRLGGIREMRSLPSLLFAVDVRQEATAIHEANLLKIPVVALVDTNCDPYVVDYVIPSNDDAIRAIKLLASKMADAVLEGKALRKDEEQEVDGAPSDVALDAMVGTEMTDEELLGEATLAKLQSGEFGEGEAEKIAEDDSGKKPESADEADDPSAVEAPEADVEESEETDETVSSEVAADEETGETVSSEDAADVGTEEAVASEDAADEGAEEAVTSEDNVDEETGETVSSEDAADVGTKEAVASEDAADEGAEEAVTSEDNVDKETEAETSEMEETSVEEGEDTEENEEEAKE